MNEKFYELKKSKQDRILNAAIKVFALKGYADAGTEAIAREAGISKGLIFHYFGTKQELFSYVYHYSVRYLLMELGDGYPLAGKELLDVIIETQRSISKVLATYPYLQLFLKTAALEQDEKLQADMLTVRTQLETTLRGILGLADLSDYVEEEVQRVLCVSEYVISGLSGQMLRNGSFVPENYMQELTAQLRLLEN